jgi:hypothetical protein
MEYQPVDRVPNYEVGVWSQTRERWEQEGLNADNLHWDWFTGEEYYGMDAREYIPVHYDMIPAFEQKVIEENDRHEIIQDSSGRIRKALREGAIHGARMSMDQYLKFAVESLDDFRKIKKRFIAGLGARYPAGWREVALPRWKNRDHVLVLGRNCSTLGFYWRAREWMGTELVSYAWYDQPELMHEMMEFIADFTIENSKPILEQTTVDYVFINEDMAMKQGPLLSPDTYREFIYPHMKRLVEYFKSNGVRYVIVDSDGNTEPLISQLMDAGVDGLWPLERASADTDPHFLRKKYGRGLRLWGAVDKRELVKDEAAIDAHLAEFTDLVEEGGFIPTVDHTVPPDISLANFEYYMKRKRALLEGKF